MIDKLYTMNITNSAGVSHGRRLPSNEEIQMKINEVIDHINDIETVLNNIDSSLNILQSYINNISNKD